MSEKNVELAQRAAEMFNKRNLRGFLALMAKDVRFEPQLGPGSDGHDGIRRLWEGLIEGGDLSVEVVDVRDLGGNSVLAVVREHGRSTATGLSFDQTIWVASTWRQGECVWWGVFLGEQDAIAAAGLRD
jgi:ketosteroid isomerase-like protein